MLTAEDFAAAGADGSHSEGIIDQLRTVAGTKVAVLIRETGDGDRRGAAHLAARDRRRGRRLGDRARVRRRRPPPRRGLLERPRARRADRRDPRAGLTPRTGHATACILLADKPAGLPRTTSCRARRALGERRIGHAGTLDPFATGLLILLVGRATRLARYLRAAAEDLRGGGAARREVVDRGSGGGDRRDRGRAARRWLPLGVVRQRPPAYSAVKIDGERAYARARRGEEVVTAEREVTVYESALLWREGDRAGLRFVCSSGTYVRSLVAGARRRRLLPGAAAGRDRALRGRRRVAGGGPVASAPLLVDGWRALRAVVGARRDEARPSATAARSPARRSRVPVLCSSTPAGTPLAVAVGARARTGVLRARGRPARPERVRRPP